MQETLVFLGGLQNAREIIELWEKAMADHPESLFLLNEAQCTQMWRNFRRVYDAFEPSFSYRHDFKQKCLHVFIDFYNIVELGGKVMEMCSNRKSWLEAAILYGDNERMFQELSDKLQFCVHCACKLTESMSLTSPSHKPVNHVEVALLPYQATVDFKRDIARLKAKLEDLVSQHGSAEEDEMHLAQYLLERQKSQTVFANSSEKKFEVDRHYPAGGVTHIFGSGTAVFTVDWLGLKCAKKEFGFSESNDEELVTLVDVFKREVSALQRLNHRNIVRLLCSQEIYRIPSILMEFVHMNLREFLNERKMRIDLAAAVDMMLQMGLGMEYLHGQGVVHRDLKGQNILVSPSQNPTLQSLGYAKVKLTDFGLAKMNVRDGDIPTYKMIGTAGWRAPEAKNPREGDRIDWRLADTYSFAITCSEILTLRRPPRDRERPVLREECPDYVREFLEWCWAENPKSRPYFEEIVSTLKTFKMHILLGTAPPQCAPYAYLFTTHLL